MKANMSVGAKKYSRSKYELLTNKFIGRQASLLLSLRCTPFKLHAWALPLCFNTVELGFLSEFYLKYLWDNLTSFRSQIVLSWALLIYNWMGWHFISPSYCGLTFENWDKKRYRQDARYLWYSAKLWRGWDKLGNLRQSIAWGGCHPISKGILTRFIVEMNYCIEEPKVWGSGVIFKLDHTWAELIEIYYIWETNICLYGTQKRFFLEVITDKLDYIHNSYERLIVKKIIPCNCFVCKNSQNSHF